MVRKSSQKCMRKKFIKNNYQNNVLFLFAKVKKWFVKYYSNNVLKKR